MKYRRFYWLAPLLLVLATAGGCGKSEEKKATQVAARVNSDEITVHQINSVLARAQNVTPEVAEQAKRQILERLIEQQLARQRAIDKKLDRTPAVMQTIEAAKTEILAHAYLEQIAAAQPKPTTDEAKKYYTDHPELFAKRRVFNLEEIAVAPQEGLAAALSAQVGKSQSMQDVAAWLKSKGAKYAESKGVRPAEQVPLELLPKLQAMKDGEIQSFDAGGRLFVVKVVSSQSAPVDEATATPRIQQFLFNQRAGEAVAKEMKEAREKAKIEYQGEFATAHAEKSAAEPKPAPKSEPGAAKREPESGMEKGIRGLR